jgi:hypothetical protein
MTSGPTKSLLLSMPHQVETSLFVGSNFTDEQGNWLAKPNAALYIRRPGPRASTDIIVILTLSEPTYNETEESITYKVNCFNSSMCFTS